MQVKACKVGGGDGKVRLPAMDASIVAKTVTKGKEQADDPWQGRKEAVTHTEEKGVIDGKSGRRGTGKAQTEQDT